MDRINSEARSQLMGRIKGKHTQPEWTVRRLLHASGYRYRLHAKDLPGKPDIAIRSRRKVIFIHGCFWHHHPDPACRKATIPATRTEFWEKKIHRNIERDSEAEASLKALGYDVLVLWECNLKDTDALLNILRNFLGPSKQISISKPID